MKKHVNITLKSWTETRWEGRFNLIEPLHYQADKVGEALLEIKKKATDPTVKVETHSLAEEIRSFRFQICCVVWYDILSQINTTCQLLQSLYMQLDVAVRIIQKNKENVISYRGTGFKDAQTSARHVNK